jgi:hypothetical protein
LSDRSEELLPRLSAASDPAERLAAVADFELVRLELDAALDPGSVGSSRCSRGRAGRGGCMKRAVDGAR